MLCHDQTLPQQGGPYNFNNDILVRLWIFLDTEFHTTLYDDAITTPQPNES
jgi:hypothetical protein